MTISQREALRLSQNNIAVEMWYGKKWIDKWVDYTLKGTEVFRIKPSEKVTFLRAYINDDPGWCAPQCLFPDMIHMDELKELDVDDHMAFKAFTSTGEFWNNIPDFEGW